VLVNTSEETTMEPVKKPYDVQPPYHPWFSPGHDEFNDTFIDPFAYENPEPRTVSPDDVFYEPGPWLSDYDDGMPEMNYDDVDSCSEISRWLTQYDELIGLPAGIFEEIMGRSGDANK
jgi:hypothetical protein